jgi:hypothetical protein
MKKTLEARMAETLQTLVTTLLEDGHSPENGDIKAAQDLLAEHRIGSIEVRGGLIASDHYGHCFIGSNESTTRWVADVSLLALGAENPILAAQVLGQGRWSDMDAVAVKDLLSDIRDNEVLEDPDGFGAYRQDTLPEWVAQWSAAQKLSSFTISGRRSDGVYIEFDSDIGINENAIKKAVDAAIMLLSVERKSVICLENGREMLTVNQTDNSVRGTKAWLAAALEQRASFAATPPSAATPSRERGG